MNIFALLVLISVATMDGKECPNGNTLLYSGVRNHDQLAISTYHAKFRYFAAKGIIPQQPKGHDFQFIKWDGKLEALAAKTLDVCNETLLNINDDRWPRVGINFAFHPLPVEASPDWIHVMNEFYLDHKNFKYPGVNNTESTFAQLLSAKTGYMGCSQLLYKTNKTLYPYVSFYVCLYGPGVTNSAPFAIPY